MTKYSKSELAESQKALDRMRTHGKYFMYSFYTIILLGALTVIMMFTMEDSPWLLLPTAILAPVAIIFSIIGTGRVGASWWLSLLSMGAVIGSLIFGLATISDQPDVARFFENLGDGGTGMFIAAAILAILAIGVVWFFAAIHLFDRLLGVKRIGKGFWRL